MKSQTIKFKMTSLYDENQSAHLAKFFKTGKGEYGEGDKFLGIKVPETRAIVKKFKDDVTVKDINDLISSDWHEIRLAGFLLLVELYKKSIKSQNYIQAKNLLNFYLSNLALGNNWDLVDLVVGGILGDWILRFPEDETIIRELSEKDGFLWHQRSAIVGTLPMIKADIYDLTFDIAIKYLNHKHDLIHKATGWMLREIGKRKGKARLISFLEQYKDKMPRTMLRYSIEKFTDEERKHFMAK